MNTEVTLEIILVKPPPDVVFGMQKGSGNNYQTLQKQTATGNDLSFKFEATVKGDRTKDKYPNLSGGFVQGPSGNKFIYIDIGTCAGQLNTIWSRRLKVPLTGITWEDIDSLSDKSILQTTVPGTGKDGGPNCATVKPFNGWQWRKS